MRSQGVLVTDEEIRELVEFVSAQGAPTFDPVVQTQLEAPASAEDDVSDEDAELVNKCLEIIRQEKRASTSMLQRRLRLGYTRAARIVDILEQRGRDNDCFVIGLSISGKMVETVGRRLQKARQAKSLSVDEVAAATKIRPERIVDLEGGDLSHFPSLVYARSFLVKYAKYLGIDIQDDLEQIQVGTTVGLGEYHYLRATPPPKYQPEPRRREPSGFKLPTVLLALLALIILIGVPVIAFLAINLSRLNGGAPSADQTVTETPSPDVKEEPSQLAGRGELTKEPASSIAPTRTAGVSVDEASPSPSASEEPNVEVRRALPVTPAEDVAQGSPSPSASAAAVETLEIRVRERTWLRVTKDKQNGEPIYNDFISPRSAPIVVQGKRFWLKLPDKNALELRKNGQAVAGPDNTIVIE